MNTKSITYLITEFLAVAITLLPATAHAQAVPKLKQGMPYSEARKILINAEWQAIEIWDCADLSLLPQTDGN